MNFIITESQLKLITESVTPARFAESCRKMNSFTNRLISKVNKKYGLNLRLLSTWGPAVGGLVMPLDNYIKNGNFEADETQRALILVGVAATLFFDNAKTIKSIVKKIQEEGLMETFEDVLIKGSDLKLSFSRFLESLGTSASSLSELVSYSFLIPIIGDIQKLISKTSDISTTASLIGERMIASGVVLVGAALLVELIEKIMRRLS
jgi:hypothetical protein